MLAWKDVPMAFNVVQDSAGLIWLSVNENREAKCVTPSSFRMERLRLTSLKVMLRPKATVESTTTSPCITEFVPVRDRVQFLMDTFWTAEVVSTEPVQFSKPTPDCFTT